ncbi:methionine aminopeptidase, type I [Streptomyces ipomoeae 91-03]|uniref:Methionine aminopeptidase n=2 Tax=Streptomyces ipomoeae TaxID=103232 RepID=L1KNP2_9ACTN|nr:methionine aminopeptidase, type I [Streptomyces ipomoeae 91-03]
MRARLGRIRGEHRVTSGRLRQEAGAHPPAADGGHPPRVRPPARGRRRMAGGRWAFRGSRGRGAARGGVGVLRTWGSGVVRVSCGGAVVPARIRLPLRVALAGRFHGVGGFLRGGVGAHAVLAGAVGALLDLLVLQAVEPLAGLADRAPLEQGHDVSSFRRPIATDRHRHGPPPPLVKLAGMSGQSLLAPGKLSPTRTVPGNIRRPEYVGKPAPTPYTGPEVQTPETIEAMRIAGRIAARAMAEAAKHIAPGVTTDELDRVAHEYMCDHGAYPSTLGYRGFPKSLCTSINEVICHGIPDSTELRDGDIVNLDVTAYIGGVHGDNNATYLVGDVDEESSLLVERTREALARAIKAVKPGRQINIIGRVIESYAKRFGYGVVRDFTGHGINSSFHSGLIIPHYDSPHATTVMQPGMTFTIEPMLTLGSYDYDMWDDGWTVVTKDRKRTAQFEHTLVVTETGAEILTLP